MQHTRQYICCQCNFILKETDIEINITKVEECCPNCNSYLAQTLRRQSVQETIPRPRLHTAYDLNKFRLDIQEIDSILQLGTIGSICISGHMANRLLTRLCVRALMPAKYGGLDSPYVIVADAGNQSDFYQTVSFARQYGLDFSSTLDRIIVSRTFTIHQLKNSICKELPKVLAEYKARIVIIPGLLELFEDPNIKPQEAKRVIGSILQAINRLAKSYLIVSSIAYGAYSKFAVRSFQKRIMLNTLEQGKLFVELDDGSKKHATLAEKELSLVSKN